MATNSPALNNAAGEVPIPGAAPTNPPPAPTWSLPDPGRIYSEDELAAQTNFFIAPPPPARDLMPLTARQVIGSSQIDRRNFQTPEQEIAAANQIPGVPLDVTSDIPDLQRFTLGLLESRDNKRRFLEGKYGAGNVRDAADGDRFIVTAMDEQTGNPREIVVDTPRLTSGDWAALAGDLPEIVGSLVGSRAAQKRMLKRAGGLLKNIKIALVGTAGAGAAGVAKDVAVGALPGYEANVPEIFRRRAPELLTDAALGTGLALAAKTIQFIRNPFVGNRSSVNINGVEAAKYLRDKYGIDVPLAPSEITGSPVLETMESFRARVPGGSGVFKQFFADRQAALEQLRRMMTGATPLPDDEIGRASIEAIQKTMAPLEAAAYKTKLEVSENALKEIEREMATRSVPQRIASRASVGDAVRAKVIALRDEAKGISDALYDKVRQLEGTVPAFDVSGLADTAGKLKKELATMFGEGLGKPLKQQGGFAKAGKLWIPVGSEDELKDVLPALTTQGKEVLRSFVPRDIVAKLDEMATMKGAKVRLTDLQQMRRRVYDAIAAGQSVPDVDTHFLSKIGQAITDAIDEQVGKAGNEELKQALFAANEFYKKRVLPFNERGIIEMFAKPDENYIGSSELASWYRGGPKAADRWNTLTKHLGPNSQEIKLLRRQVFDDVLADSMEAGGQTFNAKRFLSSVNRFRHDNPDLFREVFGNAAAPMERAAYVATIIDDYDTLPVDVVEKALATGNVTSASLKRAIDAQRQVRAEYSSELMRSIRGKSLEEAKIAPDEFVDKLVTFATANKLSDSLTNSQLLEVMFILDKQVPDVANAVRAKSLEKLFARYRDIGGISKALQDASKSGPMRSLFGDDLFRDLEKYGAIDAVMAEGPEKKASAAMAGGLAAGQRVSRAWYNPLKYLSTTAVEAATARMLLSAPMRRAVMGSVDMDGTGTWLLLSSPAFLRSIADEMANDDPTVLKGLGLVSELKRGMDDYFGSLLAKPVPQRRPEILPGNPTPVRPILPSPDRIYTE